MRIAQIAPLYEAVPPRFYGGTERIVAHLTDALVDLGHDVTLFASAESGTRATLVPMRDCALRLDPQRLKSDIAAHLSMLHEVHRRNADFDVLHFHIDLLHFPLFAGMAGRTVTTLHGRLDLAELAETYRRWPQFPLVSISSSQRRPLRFANWAGTIHHGMPEAPYTFSPRARGGYLAFLGRISPEKGPDRAISIAKAAGLPLRIAAKVDHADIAYFKERIEPLLDDPMIEFVGEIGDAEKSRFLGDAAALLFPIDWPEPFGLVMIEAMACGTPVIAWDCGAVPEIIDDGVTGRVVRSQGEAIAAVAEVVDYDRARIRATFERRFTARTMALRYEALYQRQVESQHGTAPRRTA
jgi:glycosyltransferase involved in cell wall biosynthesis